MVIVSVFAFPPTTTLWYYHIVEFIESRPFTRRLHDLAGDAADELLRAIQAQLDQNPERGAMVPGLGGVRMIRIPGRSKGNVAAIVACTCTSRKGSTFTC